MYARISSKSASADAFHSTGRTLSFFLLQQCTRLGHHLIMGNVRTGVGEAGSLFLLQPQGVAVFLLLSLKLEDHGGKNDVHEQDASGGASHVGARAPLR